MFFFHSNYHLTRRLAILVLDDMHYNDSIRWKTFTPPYMCEAAVRVDTIWYASEIWPITPSQHLLYRAFIIALYFPKQHICNVLSSQCSLGLTCLWMAIATMGEFKCICIIRHLSTYAFGEDIFATLFSRDRFLFTDFTGDTITDSVEWNPWKFVNLLWLSEQECKVLLELFNSW